MPALSLFPLHRKDVNSVQSPRIPIGTLMKPMLRLISPTIENRAVSTSSLPRRPKNAELRQREYLTPTEDDQLLAAAKQNRLGHREATMILMAYRHDLQSAEACDLRCA